MGFDKVREIIADKCRTDYAADRVAQEQFSTSPSTIRKRLALTDEMRLVLMFEDSFPTAGYIDGIPLLRPLEKQGSSIDALGLAKLKTLLDTIRRITAFFRSTKDGIYPNLKALSSPVASFPEVLRRIELILDRYGDIKDSASDELFGIRKSLRDKEAAISRRATAILRQAQEAGLADSDATVAMRDGKYLIPVSTASKRKIAGFVYDESATGKTSYVEPAEILELENDISELRFAAPMCQTCCWEPPSWAKSTSSWPRRRRPLTSSPACRSSPTTAACTSARHAIHCWNVPSSARAKA